MIHFVYYFLNTFLLNCICNSHYLFIWGQDVTEWLRTHYLAHDGLNQLFCLRLPSGSQDWLFLYSFPIVCASVSLFYIYD